jgi:hypothetical protein
MRTKLTLKTVAVFISTSKFKLFTFFLILNSAFAFTQTCNANLDVVKNRNIRSTASEGTYYKMSITNNGSSDDEYTLSSLNINNICTNTDGSGTASNVVLNISFEDNNFNPITEIIIRSGKTTTFLAHITVPVGTSFGKWCCTQVTAASNQCPSYKVNTTLHTLVINSNDD